MVHARLCLRLFLRCRGEILSLENSYTHIYTRHCLYTHTHIHICRGDTLPQALAAGTPARAGKVRTGITVMIHTCPGKGQGLQAREEEEEKGGGGRRKHSSYVAAGRRQRGSLSGRGASPRPRRHFLFFFALFSFFVASQPRLLTVLNHIILTLLNHVMLTLLNHVILTLLNHRDRGRKSATASHGRRGRSKRARAERGAASR